MRTSNGAFSVLFAVLLFPCLALTSCGDSTIDGPIVEPIEIVNTVEKLNVSIQLFSCGQNQVSLLVYNPDFDNPEFYRQSNYEVTWFVGDGHELSESIWLECVHDGTFSVQVTDMHSGVTGSSTIYL